MATDPLAAATGRERRSVGIELRHLRYFVGLAEELHFGRAAARLYISQPGLSQAVARLEQELGVTLLTRTHRQVELTEAGAKLLRRARNLLADHDETLRHVRSIGRGATGVVRVGVALLAESIVAPVLKTFGDEHEGIVLDTSLTLSERLLEQLREGRLDVAVVHQVPALTTVDDLCWEPLRQGRLAVLVSADGDLARREDVTLRELCERTFLVNSRSLAPSAYEGLKLACREFGGFDARVMESAIVWSTASTADPVRDGDAVAVVPEDAALFMRLPGIAAVPLQPPPLYVIAVAWRRAETAVQVRRLLDYLRAHRDGHAWTAS